ncbi:MULTISPECIES: ABC transporter substrate-binding protein [unclassified Mesorhizobium]|uniref:ABC transporter substrate-binding protein n=1 Tax=unclassified Mesorhizobium TaxID=325217 RepID=UPI0013EE21A5|nr:MULTISPECIES: ABC transporter substrate-binding protein [unclassified Mesorhizobium]
MALIFWATASAADVVTRFGPQDASSHLVIWGSTDLQELKPVIESFLNLHPNMSITYSDLQSADLYNRIRAGRPTSPDLTISTAADLQIKLVNDGFAHEHFLSSAASPRWPSWRNAAFAISAEPAVTVYNVGLSALGPPPQSREQLAQFIDRNREKLRGRVATYDIGLSGLGYLFATQDSIHSNTYTALVQSLGRADVALHCCSGEMLDKVEKGDVLIAYNVLGSYALARKQRGAPIEIVLPADYTLVLSRVAMIPREAKRPDLGGAFLDFLLAPKIQARFASLESYRPADSIPSQPIALDASLLVFLDPIKRARFIKAWQALIHSTRH